MGISNAWDLRLWVAKVLYEIGAWGSQAWWRREEEEEQRRERGVWVLGVRDKKEGKKEGVREITKMALFYYFLGPKLLDTRHH